METIINQGLKWRTIQAMMENRKEHTDMTGWNELFGEEFVDIAQGIFEDYYKELSGSYMGEALFVESLFKKMEAECGGKSICEEESQYNHFTVKILQKFLVKLFYEAKAKIPDCPWELGQDGNYYMEVREGKKLCLTRTETNMTMNAMDSTSGDEIMICDSEGNIYVRILLKLLYDEIAGREWKFDISRQAKKVIDSYMLQK